MKFKPKSKIYTTQVALAKMRRYCAEQERCQMDIKEKLLQYGLSYDEIDQVIAELIGENFINESRFAIQYANDKLRLKYWGRLKISIGLKQRGVSTQNIRYALERLDTVEYLDILYKLIQKKANTISHLPITDQKFKLQRYALGRGFEPYLVAEVIQGIYEGD